MILYLILGPIPLRVLLLSLLLPSANIVLVLLLVLLLSLLLLAARLLLVVLVLLFLPLLLLAASTPLCTKLGVTS